MRHPFRAAASVLTTGALSFLLSNVLPWGFNFTGFDKHHGYGYPLFTVLGLVVPIVAVVLAAFLLVYGLFGANEDTPDVFVVSPEVLRGDEPDTTIYPATDATVDGPDLDGL